MTTNKAIREIKKLWEAYNIPQPEGSDNLLFEDIKTCRSPKTREAYVLMLEMLLKEFEPLLSTDKSFGTYHYNIPIASGVNLYVSFGLMASPLSFHFYTRIWGTGDDNEWRDDMAEIRKKYDVSWSGKKNRYISFHNWDDFENTWDWAFMSLIEDYKAYIKYLKAFYGLKNAKRMALNEALKKKQKGLLFNSGVDFDQLDWSNGDPETIYSIASLYSDDENDDGSWNEKIAEFLSKEIKNIY